MQPWGVGGGGGQGRFGAHASVHPPACSASSANVQPGVALTNIDRESVVAVSEAAPYYALFILITTRRVRGVVFSCIVSYTDSIYVVIMVSSLQFIGISVYHAVFAVPNGSRSERCAYLQIHRLSQRNFFCLTSQFMMLYMYSGVQEHFRCVVD